MNKIADPTISPALSIVLIVRNGGTWISKKIGQFLNIEISNIEIILLDANNDKEVSEQLLSFSEVYSTISYAKTVKQTDGEIFQDALSLCRSDFVHVAQQKFSLTTNFFQDALAMFKKHPRTSLAYALPATLTPEGIIHLPNSSLDTFFYTKTARFLNCLYSPNAHPVEINGIFQNSKLDSDSINWHSANWRRALAANLACTGCFFEIENSLMFVESTADAFKLLTYSRDLIFEQLLIAARNFKSDFQLLPVLYLILVNAVVQSVCEVQNRAEQHQRPDLSTNGCVAKTLLASK